jgi:hypothetical protein
LETIGSELSETAFMIEWINIKDQLPINDQPCWIFLESRKEVLFGRFTHASKFRTGTFHTEDEEFWEQEFISFWQPIKQPAPPDDPIQS